jgi:hypothetical protein
VGQQSAWLLSQLVQARYLAQRIPPEFRVTPCWRLAFSKAETAGSPFNEPKGRPYLLLSEPSLSPALSLTPNIAQNNTQATRWRGFGGLRETLLKYDGHRCRVCDASGRDKRSIIVHHRVPGRSVLNLIIALCPGCHAKIHRMRTVIRHMPPLLLELWRGQCSKGHEQTALDFELRGAAMKPFRLFTNIRDKS